MTNGEEEAKVTRISDLCNCWEDGGFSIQIGADKNGNLLDNNEVTQIRNICHGSQTWPYGNRGYGVQMVLWSQWFKWV